MTRIEEQESALFWEARARQVLQTAWLVFHEEDFPSAASRAYYAAYQAATTVCLLHRDSDKFPHGWNNPSHDQLPDLIRNNGDLEVSTRRKIAQFLNQLRETRETADYRPGKTIEKNDAFTCLQKADQVLHILLGENKDDK
jgi:uncharacterized protein (UPF0332 family)